MNARTRIALIAGIGVAIPTFIFSIIGSPLCGPIFAVLGGLNVGLMVARNQVEHPREYIAATMSGLTTGTLMGIGQLAGSLIFFATPSSQLFYSQLSSEGINYPLSYIKALVFILIILAVIIDSGIVMGVALLTTYLMIRPQRNKQKTEYTLQNYPAPLMREPLQPPSSTAGPKPPNAEIMPPSAYPPPPEYYEPPQ